MVTGGRTYIRFTEEEERCKWHQEVHPVVEFATSLYDWNFGGVGLRIEVVSSSVKPMSIWVYVELVEVLKFVEWMMLHVVAL